MVNRHSMDLMAGPVLSINAADEEVRWNLHLLGQVVVRDHLGIQIINHDHNVTFSKMEVFPDAKAGSSKHPFSWDSALPCLQSLVRMSYFRDLKTNRTNNSVETVGVAHKSFGWRRPALMAVIISLLFGGAIVSLPNYSQEVELYRMLYVTICLLESKSSSDT